MLSDLLTGFRKLRRRRFWKDRISGGCFVVEAVSRGTLHHLHLHAIVYGAFLPWDTLKALWQDITGASGVYVQRIPRKAAVSYLTKYLSKTPEDPETMKELSEELKGARFFQPFGDWHNLLKPEKKLPYTCPKCGDCSWLPWEYLRMKRGIPFTNAPLPVFSHGPPRAPAARVE
jgi:hypothetical protein